MTDVQTQRPLDEYVEGEAGPDGPVIQDLLASGPEHLIWLCPKADFWYYIRKRTKSTARAIALCTSLCGAAKEALPAGALRRMYLLLACSLQEVVLSDDSVDVDAAFRGATRFLDTHRAARARAAYMTRGVVAGVLLAVLFGSLGAYLSPHLPAPERLARHLAYGAAGGALGALLSVAQRAPRVPMEPHAHCHDLAAAAVFRVLLGVIFGAAAVAAAKAGIAFAFLSDTGIALAVLGMAAGASERLVPDVLARTASTELDDGRRKDAQLSGSATVPSDGDTSGSLEHR